MSSQRPPGGGTPPWYSDGLRFECRPDCASCCTNHADRTYVYLEGDDAERLASFLGLDLDGFLARHTVLEGDLRSLKDDGPDCCFLDGHRCTVYPARPTQCRTFPFWPENVASPARWHRLREHCPGVDRGRLHPLLEIREHLTAHDLDT